METGGQASKLAIAAFIIPYIFVLYPEMLLYGVTEHLFLMIWMIVSAVVGIVAFQIKKKAGTALTAG